MLLFAKSGHAIIRKVCLSYVYFGHAYFLIEDVATKEPHAVLLACLLPESNVTEENHQEWIASFSVGQVVDYSIDEHGTVRNMLAHT